MARNLRKTETSDANVAQAERRDCDKRKTRLLFSFTEILTSTKQTQTTSTPETYATSKRENNGTSNTNTNTNAAATQGNQTCSRKY